MKGRTSATIGPRSPYVTIKLSIPVCGVENKKDVTAPFEAPFFSKDAATGITEQEQSGKGTPKIEALTIDRIPCLLP